MKSGARDAGSLLDDLISASARKRAASAPLRPPGMQSGHGWRMFVPDGFNRALDLRFDRSAGEWKQGSRFSFRPGDRLFDTSRAYARWGEAIRHLECCVEVRRAADAVPASRGKPRNPGAVSWAVFGKSPDGASLVEKKVVSGSQDDFVRFLIDGSIPESEGAGHPGLSGDPE